MNQKCGVVEKRKEQNRKERKRKWKRGTLGEAWIHKGCGKK